MGNAHPGFSFSRLVPGDICLHGSRLILVFNKTVKNRFIRLLFQQPAA
jgi:hypothetical protein